ncbi:MAG TPA: hypothetical protein VGR62_19080 [Candidatus Binatia bacterium]|nr:hypothetical protein [Candidatus Binatia bacterium]
MLVPVRVWFRPVLFALALALAMVAGIATAGGPGPASRNAKLGICNNCGLGPDSKGAMRLLCPSPPDTACFPAETACRITVTLAVDDLQGARADQICPVDDSARVGCTCSAHTDCRYAENVDGVCLSDEKTPNQPPKRCQRPDAVCSIDMPCLDGAACICPGGTCNAGKVGLCSLPCPDSNASVSISIDITPPGGGSSTISEKHFGNCDESRPFARFFCPDAATDPDTTAVPAVDTFCSRTARRLTQASLAGITTQDLEFQPLAKLAGAQLWTACGADPESIPIIVPDVAEQNPGESSTQRTWCAKVYFKKGP